MKKILTLFPSQLFILLILILSTKISAQTNCIDFFPIGHINSIEEDSNFLWLGSKENGLIRFNKLTQNIQYLDTTTTNITSNRIKAVLYYQNKLYVSTDNSLVIFENNTFITINDTISGLLLEDVNGNLAVIDKREMHILENDSIIYYQNLNAISGQTIDCCDFSTAATRDSLGNLWITRYTFYEFEILKFDGITWQSFNHTNTSLFPIESLQNNGIANIGNTIYATTWGVLREYDQGIWSIKYPYKSIISGGDTLKSSPTFIKADTAGILWLGTDNSYSINKSGEILYLINNQWHFLPLMDTVPSIINSFHFSNQDPTILYAASSTGFAIIDKSCLLVSNKKTPIPQALLLEIYPNPVREQIIVQIKEPIKKGQLIITNTQGKMLLQEDIQQPQKIIKVNSWSKGIYFITVLINEKRITRKIVIF